MNWADLYSAPAVGMPTQTVATAAPGPNQSIVTGPLNTVGGAASSQSSAVWFLGLVLALVLMRVLIAMGGRVG